MPSGKPFFRSFFLALTLTLSTLALPIAAGAVVAEARDAAVDCLRNEIFKGKLPSEMPELASSILLTSSHGEARDRFPLAVRLWNDIWTEEKVESLREIAHRARDGKELDAQDVDKELTDMREAAKFLRQIYDAFEADHAPTEDFDELVITMGKLRDTIALDSKEKKHLPHVAERLLKAVRPEAISKIREEFALFQPAGEGNFQHWLHHQLKAIDAILTPGRGTPLEFHQSRKSLQAIMSVYTGRKARWPEDAMDQNTYDALRYVTDKMGDQIWNYTERELKGELDFEKTVVDFEPKITENALKLARRIHPGPDR